MSPTRAFATLTSTRSSEVPSLTRLSPGRQFVGTVAGVGPGVTTFKVGTAWA